MLKLILKKQTNNTYTKISLYAANNFLGSLSLDWSLGIDLLEQKDMITFIYITSPNGNLN